MEAARIALFEDSAADRLLVHKVLRGSLHEIITEASSLDQAQTVVKDYAPDDPQFNVVLLDSNLTSGQHDCEDAKLLLENMRQARITAYIIGYSLAFSFQNLPVDTVLPKNAILQLPRLLESIDESQPGILASNGIKRILTKRHLHKWRQRYFTDL